MLSLIAGVGAKKPMDSVRVAFNTVSELYVTSFHGLYIIERLIERHIIIHSHRKWPSSSTSEKCNTFKVKI